MTSTTTAMIRSRWTYPPRVYVATQEHNGVCAQTSPRLSADYVVIFQNKCDWGDETSNTYRNHRKTPSFSYGDIRWCLRSRQSISSEVRGVTMKPLALAMGRSHATPTPVSSAGPYLGWLPAHSFHHADEGWRRGDRRQLEARARPERPVVWLSALP